MVVYLAYIKLKSCPYYYDAPRNIKVLFKRHQSMPRVSEEYIIVVCRMQQYRNIYMFIYLINKNYGWQCSIIIVCKSLARHAT